MFGGISLVERARIYSLLLAARHSSGAPCSSDREHETKDAGYDPRADIAPVCLAVDFSNVLVVHPGVPAPTLAEYLALARLPDGMDYGTAGVGTAGHLVGELLKARSGAKLNHVPFRGGGPAMNDLMGGHVPSLIASAPTATGFMREGRIRVLAVTGAAASHGPRPGRDRGVRLLSPQEECYRFER